MSMFKTAQNVRAVVTLFHNPNIAKSRNLLNYIEKTYPDNASRRFDFEVNDRQPTKEQLTHLERLAPKYRKEFEAEGIPRPTLVDWFNGKIAVDNESSAKEILEEIK
ncbi:hypothetical protein B9G98_04125 [Wickerhamiella sorbophila]|uniref:Uncharacterized protein n=1 Tax=Wickerhamiella sorbophila TaxID=45607 RepID=A0A2T0FNF6_9ASCO|nr:hypothetical protein B9G98_04125 [Wickerhamiella sorbophila]PRT56505.1 hypothetical protein B9G98_04125 [Wickerhamiella sorbophila]